MSTARAVGSLEPGIGVALVALGGAAAILAAASMLADNITMAATAAGVFAVALAAVVATGWVDGATMVVLSMPLPALYSTESLRIATAAPVTAVVVGAWILSLAASARRPHTGRLPANAVAALLAAFLFFSVTAQHPLTAVRETLNFAVLLGFLLAATDGFRVPGRLHRVTRALVAVSALGAIVALLEMLQYIPNEFPRYNTAFNRAALGFGQPNGLGLFFALVVPFAVHHWRTAVTRMGRAVALLALALTTVGLVSTFSRGSWLAVLAGAGALLFAGHGRLVLRIGSPSC